MYLSGESDEESQMAAHEESANCCRCCNCCTHSAEVWVCLLIDILSVIGLILETPAWYPVPRSLHVVHLLRADLALSLCSACLILFALFRGRFAAWPRRLLVRFMSLKLPAFLVFHVGYFTVSRWATPLALWACQNDLDKVRTAVGGDVDVCRYYFPSICVVNSLLFAVASAYSASASYRWFRSHPSNDDKGIWCSRVPPARGSLREHETLRGAASYM